MNDPKSSLALLDDYLSGALSEPDASRFEEELFVRAARGDAEDAEFVERVGRLGRTLQQRAGLEMGGTRSRIDELRAKGLRVDVAEMRPGVNQPAPWSSDADIAVTDYVFDLRGYTRIDVDVETADGQHLKTFRDITCDPSDGHVYAICEASLARAAEKVHCRLRVHAARDGRRQEVVVVETLPAR